MKVKDGFVLRNVCGAFVVIAVGEQTLDFKAMIELNETGAFLWEQLQQETTEAELLKSLMQEYDVDEQTAVADIIAFLQSLKAADLLV